MFKTYTQFVNENIDNFKKILLERCQFGNIQSVNDLNISYGESGRGIYCYFPNSSMRKYYSKDGENIILLSLKSDAKIIDLTKDSKKIIDFINKKISNKVYMAKTNTWQRYANEIMFYLTLNYPNQDGYITSHKGPGIPTNKQVIITNTSKISIFSINGYNLL
jgi:hypothetical protein